MRNKTVSFTADMGLCTSCGGCKNICPKEAITWKTCKGLFLPEINASSCVHCGLCAEICPGLKMEYEYHEDPLRSVYGQFIKCFNAWSKDKTIRHISASGGAITTSIKHLLTNNVYDLAFCVTGYDYRDQLKTDVITKEDLPSDWNMAASPKSRYLPVSHENAVAFIKNNPDKRVIIVASPCAIRMFRNLMNTLKLPEDNYLLLGLFCDKVFNYHIVSYFEDTFCEGKKISQLHFKNKESGGWPGNMKAYLDDGSTMYIDKSERAKVKEYFMPERCLYCVDKLNIAADISIGDNYTDQNSDILGSNSVIIRTKQGMSAWNKVKESLEHEEFPVEKLRKAQYLDGRLNNLYYARLKETEIEKKTGETVTLNTDIRLEESPWQYERSYRKRLEQLRMGQGYDLYPEALMKRLMQDQGAGGRSGLNDFMERVYYALKSRIYSILKKN